MYIHIYLHVACEHVLYNADGTGNFIRTLFEIYMREFTSCAVHTCMCVCVRAVLAVNLNADINM